MKAFENDSEKKSKKVFRIILIWLALIFIGNPTTLVFNLI